MNRPAALVGQQLRDVDVVPVHPPHGVHEELPVLAPGAVVLVVAGAHRVDQVHVARKEADEGVDRQLGVVLLALGPRLLICCRAWATDSWSTCAVASRLQAKWAEVAMPLSSM